MNLWLTSFCTIWSISAQHATIFPAREARRPENGGLLPTEAARAGADDAARLEGQENEARAHACQEELQGDTVSIA